MKNASSGVRKEIKQYVGKSAAPTQYLQSFPHTMVIMTCEWDGHAFTASGHSECGPRDKWDKDLGMTVAVGRARKVLVDKIVRYHARHSAKYDKMTEMVVELRATMEATSNQMMANAPQVAAT